MERLTIPAEVLTTAEKQTKEKRCLRVNTPKLSRKEKPMEDNPCRYCVPPVRYPGCQDICPRGAAWKAAHEAQVAEARRKREIASGVYQQRTYAVTKAYRRHGRR